MGENEGQEEENIIIFSYSEYDDVKKKITTECATFKTKERKYICESPFLLYYQGSDDGERRKDDVNKEIRIILFSDGGYDD